MRWVFGKLCLREGTSHNGHDLEIIATCSMCIELQFAGGCRFVYAVVRVAFDSMQIELVL